MSSAHLLVLLLPVALAAGWVDAVVGGGGLLQLPALLLVPGMSPAGALATNKLAGLAGTGTSATTYVRRVGVDARNAVILAAPAALGAAAGAGAAHLVPADALRPLVLVVIVIVGLVTLLRRPPAEGAARRVRGPRSTVAAIGLGVVAGVYDGVLGPGAGSLLVGGLVALGWAFLPASALAKIINASTNLGALIVFSLAGSTHWRLGAAMAVANTVGGYLGARTAVARGSAFVRVAFGVVLTVLVIRLGVQLVDG